MPSRAKAAGAAHWTESRDVKVNRPGVAGVTDYISSPKEETSVVDP